MSLTGKQKRIEKKSGAIGVPKCNLGTRAAD
jgi:hypothetical protein